MDHIDPGVRDEIRKCVDGESPWPLYLWGDVGSGKTCAALTITDWAGRAKYYTQSNLCRELLDAENGRLQYVTGYSKSRRDVWSEWKSANVAVLDELGTRTTVSDFTYETIQEAIDAREGKPFVVISNLSVEDISTVFDDRIASRLSGGTIVELSGDRRARKEPPPPDDTPF